MNFLDSIDQPTLLIDENQVHLNIKTMVERAREKNVQFRPHFKTHQSARIGEWFRKFGVKKITVSSVEMAEYFADNGWQDITIAFSINPRQVKRINNLASRIHLGILVENEEGIETLDSITGIKVDVWIKVDVGNHRTGVNWQEPPAILQLSQKILKNDALILKGLLTHSGNTYQTINADDTCRVFREGIDRLNQVRMKMEASGINNLKISVGDTPGCSVCEDWSGVDEVRPGNFVFYDATQLKIGSCKFEQIAIALACPVVAKHIERNEVVIYGGAIHLSKDFLMVDGEKSYGQVALVSGNKWGPAVSDTIVKSLSQEHGILMVPNVSVFNTIKIGDLVFILPAHSCLTVQVMGKFASLDGEVFETLNRR
jgi:D-serine deaminase-like pyridoxal phosphate-dependent protein